MYKLLQISCLCFLIQESCQRHNEKRILIQGDVIQQLEDLRSQVATMAHSMGSTYIRWGRTSCPGNGSELLYKGYIGGSYYTDPGAAVDYLCLPENPEWDYYEESVASQAKLYGGEYQFDSHNGGNPYFGHNIYQHDPVCSVCQSVRSRVLVIPAKVTCLAGWTKEYQGYLVTGAHDQPAASQYICLDRRAEERPVGQSNQNGKLLYLVEGVCGTLPCPPYVNGREIACVVCTK